MISSTLSNHACRKADFPSGLLNGVLPIITRLKGHHQRFRLREPLMISLVSQILDRDQAAVEPGAVQRAVGTASLGTGGTLDKGNTLGAAAVHTDVENGDAGALLEQRVLYTSHPGQVCVILSGRDQKSFVYLLPYIFLPQQRSQHSYLLLRLHRPRGSLTLLIRLQSYLYCLSCARVCHSSRTPISC